MGRASISVARGTMLQSMIVTHTTSFNTIG